MIGAAWRALGAQGGTDRVVPPAGFTARLTVASAAAMTFLAVFALAFALTADRLAATWSEGLAQGATVRVAATAGQLEAQVARTLEVLRTTPGVAGARRLGRDEERALLEPWLGPDLPLEALPVPALIEVRLAPGGLDADGLRARLAGEAPGAVYDDHAAWRAPLTRAAARLRGLGLVAVALSGAALAGMVALAAQAALAANAQVIATLRLVGARDATIARAFVRRFTLRAGLGAVLGTGAGLAALALVARGGAGPWAAVGAGSGPLSVPLPGAVWLWAAALPPAAALVALGATRLAAARQLRETT